MSKTSDRKELDSRKRDIFNEATTKGNRFRTLLNDESISDKQKKQEILKLRTDILKLEKDSVAELEAANNAYEKQQKLVKGIEETRKNLKGEARKQKQDELDQAKNLLNQLQYQKEIAIAKQQAAKLTADETEQSLRENKALKDILVDEENIIAAKQREARLDSERKDAAEDLAEITERIDKYSIESYRKKAEEFRAEREEIALLNKQYNELSDDDKKKGRGQAIKAKINALDKKHTRTGEEKSEIASGLTSEDAKKAFDEEKLADALSAGFTAFSENGLKAGFSALATGLESAISPIAVATMAINEFVAMSRNFFNGIVDRAADTISQYYGPVTAALEGVSSGIKDFKSLNDALESDVGLSTMVKQTAVLSNIAQLVDQGITSDIESLGVLRTIRDKTVSSFDVTNQDLRRLVRLNQQRGNLTAKQFGLADALKESFNKTFGDSTFLQSMFQSLTGTVLDAVSANAQGGGTDSTAFYSVLESWLGAMYEAGVDTGTVNSIAQGINYLGSGNVSALSGNKQLQSLMLLTMDRAGLDYASILQQGLSNGDMNKLLSTIVDYLAEITSNTKDNNVLQSSYAQLFNMSITDMTAIQNLAKSNYSALSLSGGGALSQALGEINKVGERTSMAEKINNVIDNASYSFGSSIAESAVAYSTYRLSNLVLNSIDSIGGMIAGDREGILKKGLGTVYDAISSPVRTVASITYMASLLPGLLGFGSSLLGSVGNVLTQGLTGLNGLAQVVASSAGGGMYDGSTSASAVLSAARGGGSSNSALKQFTLESATEASGISDTSSWENDVEAASEEEDENTKILKEFEKTLMKNKDSDNYAFAVSLQGMSDGVLRSFASIFADEEAMLNTMTGKNNALEKNNTFIDYIEGDESKPKGSTSK